MSTFDATVAPDLPAAVEAWRAWRVVRHGDTYELGSVLKPTVWPRRQALVAECLHPAPFSRRIWRRPERHPSPEFRCECGIYGADLKRVGEYLTPSPFEHTAARVFGRVSLWGTVIECQRGYRASHAYPLFIYVPSDAARDDRRLDELATALGDYGVPVEVLPERCSEARVTVERLLQKVGSR